MNRFKDTLKKAAKNLAVATTYVGGFALPVGGGIVIGKAVCAIAIGAAVTPPIAVALGTTIGIAMGVYLLGTIGRGLFRFSYWMATGFTA